METLKFTVERTASDLEAMRRQVNELKKDVEEKKRRYVLLTLFTVSGGILRDV